MTFGKRMRKVRNSLQLTQTEVAQALEMDFTTISKYENDNSQPNQEILQKLANLYQVSIDWLITGQASLIHHEEINIIWVAGDPHKLTSNEANHLKERLDIFRQHNPYSN